jgi:uncharacterized membrane protein
MRLSSQRLVALLALVAALLSFAKFDHCRHTGWATPDVYVHMCYSDLSALYGAREINQDHWPYSSATNSVEYPVVTGIVMWATGLLVKDENGYRQYFDLNALLLGLLMIAASLLVWRIRPEFSLFFPLAPAVIGSLYINWDLWAVVPALLAILFFAQERISLSAIFLGIAIATKFFPIVLLLGVTLILGKGKKKKLIQYLAVTLITWLLINVPAAISHFDGWWRFFKLNIERSNDLGSLWYALSLLKLPSADLNYLSLAIFLAAIFGIAIFYRKISENRSDLDNFMTIAFISVAAFVTISKVYSPQYILWLTPLAVIAMSRREERSAFWVWQAGEAIYHLAIWQYLASYTGAKFGLPATFYALLILVRIGTLGWFVLALVRTALTKNAQGEAYSQVARLGFLTDGARG